MNRYAKAAMERTGKPYGGHINNCVFLTRRILNITDVTIATGDLPDDPRGRFGVFGNFGFTTSYIVKKRLTYIETRNTIYTYTEEVYHEPEK